MSKKLAIKGHPTRGKEVIELLEMIGGKNCYNFSGFNGYAYYVIEGPHNEIRAGEYIFGDEDMHFFTLEEFLEKYPFKIGDKVFLYDNITEGCVTGMKWEENTVKYCVYTSAECWCDVKELLKWNAIDLVEKNYRDNMEEKDKKLEEAQSAHDKSIFIMEHSMWPIIKDGFLEYKIVDDYEFDKVENGKIILKQIKPKYPKTYKECCDVLLIPPYYNLRYHTYERGYNEYATSNTLLSLQDKLNTLGKLIICRDAYWKIAGEEMGLGKPWDSTYGCGEWGYWFGYSINENKIYLQDSRILVNHTLVFPTEEMRDAFYENFKDLIEECKKLL